MQPPASPVLLAFSLIDNTPEWPELALAVGGGLVAAYAVMLVVRRIVRWALNAVVGARNADAYLQSSRGVLMSGRLLLFLLLWALLSLPLLEAVGQPLDGGMSGQAVRGWLLGSGVRVAVLLIVSWLVLRVVAISTERIERELSQGEGLDVIDRTKRAQTLGRLVHNVTAVIVSLIALMMVLRELGVDILPMLTGAGIVGVALGFGAQWLVRDVIAGFFIILENQVRVGDVVAINNTGGVVEAINLRTIILRDGEGTVHVFPNGGITTLANRSKDYAYALIDLQVLYDQDVDRVVDALREVGRDLQADPAFGGLVLEPMEVMGVEAFLDTRMTIRLRMKTLPQKQWDVGRELRRRIKIELERRGIPLTAAPVPIYVADRGSPRPDPLRAPDTAG